MVNFEVVELISGTIGDNAAHLGVFLVLQNSSKKLLDRNSGLQDGNFDDSGIEGWV